MRWTKRTAGFAAVMVMGMGMAACQPSGEQPAAEQQQQQPAAQAPAAQPAAPAELPAGVTQEMYAQGQALFTGQGICYTCHGMNAEGRSSLRTCATTVAVVTRRRESAADRPDPPDGRPAKALPGADAAHSRLQLSDDQSRRSRTWPRSPAR